MSLNYSDISFSLASDYFQHNLEADYALIVLWKNARPFRDKIRDFLSHQFEVLLESEIEWSEENFHSNASRLYEAPMFQNIPQKDRKSNHAAKIGDHKFIVFVVKDLAPKYSYAMSVSKKIEMSNLNIVAAKREIRAWIFKDSGAKYGVHSTNSIYEFFFQTPLLLGVDLFKKLLNGEKQDIDYLKKDLEGANGWKDWKTVFDILNLTNNYVILRSYEGLPIKNTELDIDLLTDNFQRVASALGVIQSPKYPYKGYINVGGEQMSVDMRFIGDKYYDIAFQKEMLQTKINKNGFFQLREDMYFFSLLFHCKVHKYEVKEKYVGLLASLAKELNFTWYKKEDVFDDKTVGEILKGYYQAHYYFYEDPIDRGVIRNKQIIQYLPNQNALIQKDSKKIKLKRAIRKMIPDKVVSTVKKMIGK